MERPTKGHELFERWLIDTFGESTRSPGRPRFDGLRQARKQIAVEVKNISRKLDPPKTALILYHWIASAQASSRKVPRRHIRVAIEAATGGAVPRGAWEEPVETPDASNAPETASETALEEAATEPM